MKSKAVLFTNNKDHEMADNVCHNVHLNGETVEQVPVYKYLGIQFNHNLKFNCQFNHTYKVASHYQCYVFRAINDTTGKPPVYCARELWNKLAVLFSAIIAAFKSIVRKEMYNDYISEEMARLTAGVFI